MIINSCEGCGRDFRSAETEFFCRRCRQPAQEEKQAEIESLLDGIDRDLEEGWFYPDSGSE